MAVTTLRFLGSTAPTATSVGVVTMATSLGGAVRIAALPNRIGNPPFVEAPIDNDNGVVPRGEGLAPPTLKRPVVERFRIAGGGGLAKDFRFSLSLMEGVMVDALVLARSEEILGDVVLLPKRDCLE